MGVASAVGVAFAVVPAVAVPAVAVSAVDSAVVAVKMSETHILVADFASCCEAVRHPAVGDHCCT